MTLHVTNGESTAVTLREARLDGEVLAWNDVLHVGPLEFALDESRPRRAAFLAEHGWADAATIEAGLRARDDALARAAGQDTIVLWFEHDLYDQLQLLQILASLPTGARVELVQSDVHLGPLDDRELVALFPRRRAVDAATFELARAAWRAVCEDDIASVLERDTSALPHLAPALRRLLEERAALPRTRRQLLRAVDAGARTPFEAFVANQEMEEAVFLGDTWAFVDLYELAREGLLAPLPPPPPRGDHATFADAPLELTEAGRRVIT